MSQLLSNGNVWFGVALAIAAGFLAVREQRLRRYVRLLIGVTERLGRGELDQRVTLERAPAELGPLGDSLGQMAFALLRREQHVASRADRLAAEVRRDRTLLEHGSSGLVLVDAELRILYATAAVTRGLGYTDEQVLGTDAVAFVHQDDRERVRALLRALAANPGGSTNAVVRAVTADGSTLWFDAEASNLLDVPDVGAIVTKYRDVTKARQERLKTERMLEQLSRAIEQSADSVFITAANGVIEYVNPAFEALTGYTRDEAVGQTPRLLKSPRTPPATYERLWRTIAAGEVFREVLANQTKNGQIYDEDQTITPIRDESGAITHYVSTGRDVTQRIRMQEAVVRLNTELERQASRFAGVLHDEAGQFLTAAHLTLAAVAREVPGEFAGRLGEVRYALDQIEARLRSLSHEIHPDVVEERGLVEALSATSHAFSLRTGIRVQFCSSIARRFPIAIEAVIYRLVQEGLTNIHRHAAADTAWVSLVEERGALCCAVKDNGGGFDMASLDHNTGHLGLRLMQDRLESVGGTLAIVSGIGDGTELRASIPVEASAHVDAHPAG